ncbi:hypothetical protein IFR05_012163 [Cadophora sp. M221]|nr:hypothetical protein IFR05_012163 [Cadophora sp. M221]
MVLTKDSVAGALENSSVEAPSIVLESILESELSVLLANTSIEELGTPDTSIDSSNNAELLGNELETGSPTDSVDCVDTAEVSIEVARSSDEEAGSTVLEGIATEKLESTSELDPTDVVGTDDDTAISEVKPCCMLDSLTGETMSLHDCSEYAKLEVCTRPTLTVEVKIDVSTLKNTSMPEVDAKGTAIDSENVRLGIETDGKVKLKGTATDEEVSRLGEIVAVDSVIEGSTPDVGKMRSDSDAVKVGIGIDDNMSTEIEGSKTDDCKMRLIEGFSVGSRETVEMPTEIEDPSIVDGLRLESDALNVRAENVDKSSIVMEYDFMYLRIDFSNNCKYVQQSPLPWQILTTFQRWICLHQLPSTTEDDRIKLEKDVGTKLDVGTSMEIEDASMDDGATRLIEALATGTETDVRTSTEDCIVERGMSELDNGSDRELNARVIESAEESDNTLGDASSVDAGAELSVKEDKKDSELAIGAEDTMGLGNWLEETEEITLGKVGSVLRLDVTSEGAIAVFDCIDKAANTLDVSSAAETVEDTKPEL